MAGSQATSATKHLLVQINKDIFAALEPPAKRSQYPIWSMTQKTFNVIHFYLQYKKIFTRKNLKIATERIP